MRVGPHIVVAGTAPIAAAGGAASPGDVYGQTRRCLEIAEQALRDAGAQLRHVSRTRMMLTDIARWREAARAHGEYFREVRPACTFIEVSLFIDPAWLIEIEIDAIVVRSGPQRRAATMRVRDAETKDLPQILAIYNEVIATSTAVYATAPTSLEERATWYEQRRERGFPVLVAADGEQVLGFSSFGEFRGAWSGFRYSVEHSVHVHADARGRHVGRLLVEALFPIALASGKHLMIGGVDAANAGSVRFHERLGFERVAHFKEVGHKFGRWLDLVFMQRFLDAPGSAR